MTDYQKQIAEALPDSLNSQHRQVLAEQIERAIRKSALEVIERYGVPSGEFGIAIDTSLEAGIKALRGDG